jgi:hypothetical protein
MVRRRKKASEKTQPAFRNQVGAELVDQLLYRFVALVKLGLHLVLTDPSELAKDEWRQHLHLHYTEVEIPAMVVWVAQGVMELPWAEFCQHVLNHPEWMDVLGVSGPDDLHRLSQAIAQWEQPPIRQIELAVHDGLKDGDKRDRRAPEQRPTVQNEYVKYIGASRVLKLLKKQLRPFLKRLDALDPPHPAHRKREYRTRSFLLSDVLRWMLGLQSTEELRRKLENHVHLAGAVNFEPKHIPSAATFSRRRMVIPLDDLKAILHALVEVLIKCRVIDGRAWVVDLTRVPTHASVIKTFVESPNGKSDPQAAFCGYPDNDGGHQFGYCLVWIVDFKTELPFALLFGAGDAHDSPLALPLLKQACAEHPTLQHRCQYVIADGSYDSIAFFEFVLDHLRAIATVTKNPRNAPDPTADLSTDAYCVLRRGSLAYHALFNSRTSVERANSWAKLTFNLKYHKYRGWDAIERCVLFAAIAMLGVAWVAVKTGHPEKIRCARTWISLN